MVQSLGTEGPIDWLLSGAPWNLDRRPAVSRVRVSAKIAWGALSAKIIREWHSIGKEQGQGDWMPIAVFVGTFVAPLRLLLKDAEPR